MPLHAQYMSACHCPIYECASLTNMSACPNVRSKCAVVAVRCMCCTNRLERESDPPPMGAGGQRQFVPYRSAYSGYSTRNVIMEERNVFCGAFNTLVICDQCAAHPQSHSIPFLLTCSQCSVQYSEVNSVLLTDRIRCGRRTRRRAACWRTCVSTPRISSPLLSCGSPERQFSSVDWCALCCAGGLEA